MSWPYCFSGSALGTATTGLDRIGLEHGGLVNHAAFGEARKIQQRSVDQVCLSGEDEVT